MALTTKEIGLIQSNLMTQYGSQALKGWRYFNNDEGTVPIFSRTSISPMKKDSMVNTHANFVGIIVEQKVGYFGEINVFLKKTEGLSDQFIVDTNKFLRKFQTSNQADVLNPESIRWTAAEGLSHRLMFLSDGKPRVRNLHGWQVLYDYEADIYNPKAAYVFYTVRELSGKVEERMDIYTKTTVEYYRKYKNGWLLRTPDDKTNSIEQHYMGRVPVFPIYNNEMINPDCPESVLKNVDAYDVAQSDILSEMKASRLAYLKVWGEIATGFKLEPDGEFTLDGDGNKIAINIAEYLREFGTLIFKTDDDGKKQGDAEFLQKNMNDDVNEHNLDRVREQVFNDSMAVDERSILQGANQRVIAIISVYDRLEKKCNTFKKYLTTALKVQYELLFKLASEKLFENYSLTKEQEKIVVENLTYNFDYLDIVDPEVEARILALNLQTMSRIDAYALSNMIDDPIEYCIRYQEEIDEGLYLPGTEQVIVEATDD